MVTKKQVPAASVQHPTGQLHPYSNPNQLHHQMSYLLFPCHLSMIYKQPRNFICDSTSNYRRNSTTYLKHLPSRLLFSVLMLEVGRLMSMAMFSACRPSHPNWLLSRSTSTGKNKADSLAKSCAHFDERLSINQNKLLRPKRPGFQFINERKLAKQAKFQRVTDQFGQAQAKDQKHKEEIPDIEPWDSEILLSATYEDISISISISMEKLDMNMITMYVQHPEPLEPPSEPAPPRPRPLKLTNKEQKKLRTHRRLAKERERQEMIRQGLLQPPMPKVKMSNLMKVLGAEATQDPTRLEMEVRMAAAEREQAHADRNTARKLTPSERRDKKQRKLFDDPHSLDHTTIVCVYRIRDLSHWQARFKVEANAQENRLTGAAVITDTISVVVVEGGNKSIRRYHKLMMNRMDWAAAAVGGDEDVDADEEPDKPANSCALVWQGSVVKPKFTRFNVHRCRSDAAAKKVFVDVDAPHYWDLAVNFA